MSDENGRGRQIPGFTPEQSWVLRTVAKEAAEAAVAALRAEPDCPFHCADMDAVKTVLFGRAEAGIRGLDERVATNEQEIERLAGSRSWLLDRIVAPVVVGLIMSAATLISTLIATGHLLGE